jgi:four helix bundle protein
MLIRTFRDLIVYQRSHALAMGLFQDSKKFPPEEKYSLTDQCRRASRSVAANIAESWGKRRYPASFVSKLSDSEAEALETQAWIAFAVDCEYLDEERGADLIQQYEELIKSIAHMANHPDDWCFPTKKR